MKGERYYAIWRKINTSFAYQVRKGYFNLFIKLLTPTATDHVLDVGVTADIVNKGENYFEQFYPWPANITALGVENAKFLEIDYPGLKFIQGDGTKLPFADQSFDIVFSSATAEHVGSNAQQEKFYHELLRVGKKVFATTPNRFFVLEVHTGLPFLHWLPKPWYRAILRFVGLHWFADEANLNLLTVNEVKKMVGHNPRTRVVKQSGSIIIFKK